MSVRNPLPPPVEGGEVLGMRCPRCQWCCYKSKKKWHWHDGRNRRLYECQPCGLKFYSSEIAEVYEPREHMFKDQPVIDLRPGH